MTCPGGNTGVDVQLNGQAPDQAHEHTSISQEIVA